MNATIFRRLGLILVLIASLTVCSLAQGIDPSKESRLQALITVKLKIAQLPDALKQLGKLAGVRLTCIAPISDLKVTVLVKDVPVGLVLAKIANALDCEWKADGDVFRLTMDPNEIKNRDRYVLAENQIAQKEISDQINRIAEAASIEPKAAEDEIRDNRNLDPERLAVLNMVDHSPDASLASSLSRMTPQQATSFWRGEVVASSPVPISVASQNADGTGEVGGGLPPRSHALRIPVGATTLIQYDPVLYQVNVWQGGAVRHFSIRPRHLVSQFVPTGKLASLPFGKAVLAWDQPVPTNGDLTKVSLAAANPDFGNAGRRFSVSDLLEDAFDATGVPIVADAFRVSSGLTTPEHGAEAFTGWLENLKQKAHVSTRFEDGIVIVRHGGFWRLRAFEVPEENLVPLDRMPENGLTLSDYASLVAKLTVEQATALALPGEAVTKFDTRPIEQGLPALRFFASIESQTIAQAQGNGVAFDQLGQVQRQLFQIAVLEGAFYGTMSTRFTPYALRLASSGDSSGLGFLIRPAQSVVNGMEVDGQSLIFGLSPVQGTTFNLAIGQ